MVTVTNQDTLNVLAKHKKSGDIYCICKIIKNAHTFKFGKYTFKVIKKYYDLQIGFHFNDFIICDENELTFLDMSNVKSIHNDDLKYEPGSRIIVGNQLKEWVDNRFFKYIGIITEEDLLKYPVLPFKEVIRKTTSENFFFITQNETKLYFSPFI